MVYSFIYTLHKVQKSHVTDNSHDINEEGSLFKAINYLRKQGLLLKTFRYELFPQGSMDTKKGVHQISRRCVPGLQYWFVYFPLSGSSKRIVFTTVILNMSFIICHLDRIDMFHSSRVSPILIRAQKQRTSTIFSFQAAYEKGVVGVSL